MCGASERIYFSQKAMVEEYHRVLDILGEPHAHGSRKLRVRWACGHWKTDVANILAILGDEKAIIELKYDQAEFDDQAAATRQDEAALFAQLVLRAASQRAWSQASYSELPPMNWAALLSDDRADAQCGMERIYSDCQVIRSAQKLVDVGGHEAQPNSCMMTWFSLHNPN